MIAVLLGNVQITNCTDGTTPNSIIAVRDTYEEAGAVRDLFTEENSKVITIKDDKGAVVSKGANLILLSGCSIEETEDGKVSVTVSTRYKTNEEILEDRVADLEEAVIG